MHKRQSCFSLAELLIVIVIISVLAGIAFPVYRKAVTESKDKEALAMVRLMYHAEEIYQAESTTYQACGTTVACNAGLKLSIPSGGSADWTYQVQGGGASACSQATSTALNPPARSFHMRNTDTEPQAGGC